MQVNALNNKSVRDDQLKILCTFEKYLKNATIRIHLNVTPFEMSHSSVSILKKKTCRVNTFFRHPKREFCDINEVKLC